MMKSGLKVLPMLSMYYHTDIVNGCSGHRLTSESLIADKSWQTAEETWKNVKYSVDEFFC